MIDRRTLIAVGPLLLAPIAARAGGSATLPAMVDRALSEAEAQARLVVSFSMRFRWKDAPPVVERFDAIAARWTAIAGDPAALGSAGRRKFNDYRRRESAPGGLVAGDYRRHLQDVASIGETGMNEVFAFSARAARALGDAAAVEGRLHVDRVSGGLMLYRIEAQRAFSPAPATRIDEFLFEHQFARMLDDAPPLMVKARIKARGRRALTTIDEDYEADFFDFARP